VKPLFNLERLLSVALAIWFVLYSTNLFTPVTPEGRQCPTAPVQRLAFGVYDCCGKLVSVGTRAPKPGDKAFVQCRCAEKNAAHAKAAGPDRPHLYLASREELALQVPLSESEARFHHRLPFDSFEPAPSERPPDPEAV
jgi:hypothetical protein